MTTTTVASAPTMTTTDHDTDSVDGDDAALLRAAVARAVDFRGDVTLALRDGTVVEGFAFDARLGAAAAPAEGECIRILPVDSNERRAVPLAQIARLSFTGKDAASGKSWENWIRRYAAKKLAGEAASIESEPV
jgi:hypothetical protein